MSIYFYYYEDELLYVGSSIDMEKRIINHRNLYKKDILSFYKQLKENGLRLEDLDVEEVKTEIADKQELRLLEGQYQRLYKPQCNKRLEGRSKEEWYEDNKDKVLARLNENFENNKDLILEKQKQYYENNKDTILEQQREYREVNKEKIATDRKKYYENNKDIISQKSKEYRQSEKYSIYKENNKEKIRGKKTKLFKE